MKTKPILHLAAAFALLHTAGCMTPPKTTKPVYRQEARQWQLASIVVLPIPELLT
ncbi:MAG: hypothetical protein AAB676_11595 [Verrucomicrobiota bacterium]